MRESRIRLLVLRADYTQLLSYYTDWADAFAACPAFSTIGLDIVPGDSAARVKSVLADVDAVVLLHSTNADTTVHLENIADALAGRRCPLLSFVGNEVNLPGAPIAKKREVLAKLAPDWIATQLLKEAGDYLFGDLVSRAVVSIPHALNPDAFRPVTDPATRPIDIGTRVAHYHPHLGDSDRNRIASRFAALGRERGWAVDIANDRFDRPRWADFLNRCKATVSTEAGSWYIERDDATVNEIRNSLRAEAGGMQIANDSALLRIGGRLPRPLRRLARRLFAVAGGRFEYQMLDQMTGPQEQDIIDRFFAAKPRPPVYGKCASSRHFDAAGTKTCQIMFRGRFNDIFEADRHYLALDRDFGNVNDVIARFSDPDERLAVAERAYRHILEHHTYAHRVRQVEAVLRGGE